MSLLHPTLGEMYDRVVVLSVKIACCEAGGGDPSRFRNEMNEIAGEITRISKIDKLEFPNERKRLTDIHDAMFNLIAVAESGVEVSSILLQKLNRQRVQIRESIDKAVGQFEGSERI